LKNKILKLKLKKKVEKKIEKTISDFKVEPKKEEKKVDIKDSIEDKQQKYSKHLGASKDLFKGVMNAHRLMKPTAASTGIDLRDEEPDSLKVVNSSPTHKNNVKISYDMKDSKIHMEKSNFLNKK